MMRKGLILGAVALVALSGCEGRDAARRPDAPSAKPPEQAFLHQLGADVSGEYRAVDGQGPVAALFVGQEAAFAAWEAGDRTSPPLILTLSGPEGEMQVAPTRYDFTDDGFRFSGVAPTGEKVDLRGRLDQGALATARRNLGDTTPVVTGVLTSNGRSTPFSLSRWGGD